MLMTFESQTLNDKVRVKTLKKSHNRKLYNQYTDNVPENKF